MSDSGDIRSLLRQGLLSHKRLELAIPGFHRAGVLVPLLEGTGEAELLFTQRTLHVETHKGQISFPGGMVDPGDTDITATALREMEEEIGVHRSVIEIVGLLDDLSTPSGFLITPVVGILQSPPRLTLNTREVAEAFHVPLSFFRNPGHARREFRNANGTQHEVWFYEFGGKVIWGATAHIVRTLLHTMGVLPHEQQGPAT
jgi:8-oxo-dGTP pyrophosphatase MutT (NUDIX family)